MGAGEVGEIGRQLWESFRIIVRPTIFDGHILVLDIPLFAQTLSEAKREALEVVRRSDVENPTTGIVRYCAPAENGTMRPPPPNSAINSHRLIR
jgi:hypothetical protein